MSKMSKIETRLIQLADQKRFNDQNKAETIKTAEQALFEEKQDKDKEKAKGKGFLA